MQLATEELTGGITKVVLNGRLDIAGTQAVDVKMNVIADSKKLVLIDMQRVSFLGSMGVRAIYNTARAIQNHGGKLVLFGPDQLVEKVLKTGGVDAFIPIHHELQTALAALE